MRFLLIFFSFFLAHGLSAQQLLKGVVLDAEKGGGVPKASVFLNNTSVGTTTNEDGSFQLTVPAGRYELIVSSVGYVTQNIAVTASESLPFLTVKLRLKAADLEEIIIEPYEKDGWQKWGRWFIDNFLGTSAYGRETRIKNPEVLKFRNSKQNNELRVSAVAPLVIENQALGYRVTYQLENFSYSFRTRYLLYSGYPFFAALPGSDRRQRKWEQTRKEVYFGSMLHFMRAVYRNTVGEEGFEMRRLQKIPNAEKQRVKAVLRASVRTDENGIVSSTIRSDSSNYYNNVMAQDDYSNVIGKDVLPGDSVAHAIDSVTAGLFFPNHLLVLYKGKNVSPDFKRLFPRSADKPLSELTLVNGVPISIQANGAYYNPEELLNTGYWAWSEKMGTMLPYDYWPEK